MSDPIARLSAALAGRYRIERRLGEGGMAAVYLADDLRHERKVALKVLKSELAAVVGAERFLAEIKTTANLQHPHILPLFDSGEADGSLFYVMPHVEGESLRDRLAREHQLPVDDAVRIATKVARALQEAHERGVIHRDIKPANILLSKGEPLVSDFGIALAVGAAGGGRLTETGISLGTPHYMSPEQATGDLSLGAATDVYAVGCVLYEMLVGEPPFTGSTPQAILGKIIASAPPSVTVQRPSVPENVAAAVTKALEKIPADRFTGAGRFADALADPAFAGTRRGLAAARRPTAPSRWAWPAATVVATGVALWVWLRPGTGGEVVWTQLTLPDGQLVTTAAGGSHPLAISPDGRQVAYVAEFDGGEALFLRALGERTPVLLEGTEGASRPFFSPDGDWVGYFAAGRIHRASIIGGAPIAIAVVPAQQTYGASWGDDGTILFSAGASLYRVPASGGDPEVFDIVLEGGDRLGADSSANVSGGPRWPHHLPDGKHVLASVPQGTAVADLSTGRARVLLTGAQARYVAPGYLVFNAGEERLRAVRFDLDRLEVHGAEVPAVEGVFRGPGGGAAAFAISQTGTLVYLAGGFERSLWLVDRDGREERIGVEPRGYRWPRVAPNGRRIVAAVDPRPSDIWIVDLEREVAQPLTTEGHHVNPAWAPDSERIVFSLDGDLHEMALRSGGAPRRISDRPGAQYMPSWSVNDVVMVNEPNPESAYDLVVIEVADGSARPFVATPANEVVPAFSPDGRWVTYASDASGRYEVYVTAFPGPGPRYTVSAGGGNEPKWASSGDEIIYRGADRMWAVAVTTSPEFSVGAPRALFEPARYDFSQANNWDLAPDGRFVMVKSDPSMRRQLELVQNFPEELERRLSN